MSLLPLYDRDKECFRGTAEDLHDNIVELLVHAEPDFMHRRDNIDDDKFKNKSEWQAEHEIDEITGTTKITGYRALNLGSILSTRILMHRSTTWWKIMRTLGKAVYLSVGRDDFVKNAKPI